MPYCKSVAVHRNVKQTLTYILNPDKTDERVLTISVNCMTEPEFAYTQMKTVYEQYARRSYDDPPSKSGKSPVKTIHYIMSFADSENVTPELAHKIGMAFVRKMFGDDVQAVIAKITSVGDLEGIINRLSAEYEIIQEQLSEKLLKQEKMRALIHQSEYYFANIDRIALSVEENNRLEICKSSMQANNINSPDDIAFWRDQNNKLLSEIADIKNSVYEKKNQLVRYLDIMDTYKEVSRGDYISRLVEEERQRKEYEIQPPKKKPNKRR